jgi:hypothetical protein
VAELVVGACTGLEACTHKSGWPGWKPVPTLEEARLVMAGSVFRNGATGGGVLAETRVVYGGGLGVVNLSCACFSAVNS